MESVYKQFPLTTLSSLSSLSSPAAGPLSVVYLHVYLCLPRFILRASSNRYRSIGFTPKAYVIITAVVEHS